MDGNLTRGEIYDALLGFCGPYVLDPPFSFVSCGPSIYRCPADPEELL